MAPVEISAVNRSLQMSPSYLPLAAPAWGTNLEELTGHLPNQPWQPALRSLDDRTQQYNRIQHQKTHTHTRLATFPKVVYIYYMNYMHLWVSFEIAEAESERKGVSMKFSYKAEPPSLLSLGFKSSNLKRKWTSDWDQMMSNLGMGHQMAHMQLPAFTLQKYGSGSISSAHEVPSWGPGPALFSGADGLCGMPSKGQAKLHQHHRMQWCDACKLAIDEPSFATTTKGSNNVEKTAQEEEEEEEETLEHIKHTSNLESRWLPNEQREEIKKAKWKKHEETKRRDKTWACSKTMKTIILICVLPTLFHFSSLCSAFRFLFTSNDLASILFSSGAIRQC